MRIMQPILSLLNRWSERKLFATLPGALSLDRNNLKEVFTTIYQQAIWGGGSGGGSAMEVAKPYVELLQTFIKEHSIASVLDIGCGDWSFARYMNWTAVNYLGLDVVETVIEENEKKFGASNIHFKVGNVSDDDFEIPSVDLVLIKDVFQHLSNNNIIKILRKIKTSKYCLITNDYAKENEECKNGDTRPVNILSAPFFVNGREVLHFNNKKTILIVN